MDHPVTALLSTGKTTITADHDYLILGKAENGEIETLVYKVVINWDENIRRAAKSESFLFNLDNHPDIEIVTNSIGRGTNQDRITEVQKWDGQKYSHNAELTKNVESLTSQFTSIASSNDPKKQQQMKNVIDKDPVLGYAALSSLYP